MSLETVRADLAARAPDLDVMVTDASTATVQLAAEVHGCAPGQIAKTLAIRVNGDEFLLVTRGDARLDNRKAKAAFGGRPRMLGAEDVLRLTSHEVGGVCPFGLPAPLTIIEERTVGPGLGQDSIDKGTRAAWIGSLLVIIFMFATYGLFGLFANIAVAINVAMIFGILSLLNATLTLPGIAGIVLTVGIAVDSNVLIYERIREEVRAGRSPLNAIEAGFKRALATILDSNITTFIAAAVLFYIGTGPVRGFAVTLGIGIITTVFTAFTLTGLLVAAWVRWFRPQTVPI
ncbi:MAG: protein translocase subunit SecD [Pseudorhodoplanes sp.]|nr:protein translocase subunit SecD [Pseudorhodoplanes sp.]